MRGQEVHDLIEAAVGAAHISTNGWYRTTCPMCVVQKGSRDKKASLGFLPSSGFFYCLRCSIRGFLRGDFYEMAQRVAKSQADAAKPPEELDPPEGYEPLGYDPALNAVTTKAAREYLLKRGVHAQIWRESHVGVTFSGFHAGRIIVPVVSFGTNQWVGWVGRVWRPREGTLNYRYPQGMKRGQVLWNSDVLFDDFSGTKPFDDPAVVVEGVFDGLPHWPHAVACLGKPTRAHFQLLLRAKRPLVVALDGDAWREGQALAMRLQFAGRRATYLRLPPCTDPNDMEPGELIECARKALAAQREKIQCLG